MKILVESKTKNELQKLLLKEVTADYVYMYPPRQAYRNFGDTNIESEIRNSLAQKDDLNLYFHFPFCRQICAFCNLYSHVCTDTNVYELYIDYLKRELSYYLPWISGKRIKTIYLGGGTPSLLSPELIKELFLFIQNNVGCQISNVPEVAIEIAPETINQDKLKGYKDIGINRINLGLQSFANHELHLIGRKYDTDTPYQALKVAQQVGFKNICIDLIYGLEDQSLESWEKSVESVLDFSPETICAYALTLRPKTGFSARGYFNISGEQQYRKYDYINERLSQFGYKQETHVRWVKNENGGYLQKSNHWALENVLGLGAGARSYLWGCDFRNGYSVQHRSKAFKDYLSRVDEIGHGRKDGLIINEEERVRKAMILGLINLDRKWFNNLFGADPDQIFSSEIDILISSNLLSKDEASYKLTPLGIKYRDIIVQLFFSDRVLNLIKSFDYAE